MSQRNEYVNVKTDEDARRVARITKAKLGMTWSEFHHLAARTLDPDYEVGEHRSRENEGGDSP